MRTTILMTVLLRALVLTPATAAAHSWYPWECCHEMDCAPVDQVQSAPELDGVIVTSKVGTALIPASFPKRVSKDNRMHVCLRKDATGTMKVLCVFVPPET